MRRAALALALFAFVLLALAGLASTGLAAWSTSPSVNLPVRVATGGASNPMIIPDGSGGALLAWSDGRNSGVTGDDIYAAHILKNGTMDPAWPVNGLLVCNATGDQEIGALVSDNAGGMIIVWQDGRGATLDIYGARVNANGTFATGWTTVNGKLIGASTPSGLARDDAAPVACTDGAGGVIVAWTVTYIANSDYDIYANRIQANGTVASGWQATGSIVNAAGGYQDSPAIAEDGLGGAIIAYQDIFLTPYGQIRYRTANASGVVTIPASDQLSPSGFLQASPIGISDGLGGMFVAWLDQRVSPAGIGVGQVTPAGVNGSPFSSANPIFGVAGDICLPSGLVLDGNGGLYLAFYDVGLQKSVHLTHVNGNALIAPGWANTGVSLGVQYRSGVVADGTGGVIAAASNLYDITGIRYLANGSIPGGWGFPTYLCNAPNYQQSPAACSDGSNGMIAIWSDSRDSYRNMYGFYAQRVDRFGALGDASPSIAGVKDTPNDQGGHVRLSWNPSYMDAEPTRGISNYYVYRQLPTHFAVQQVKAGRLKVASDESAPHDPGTLRVTRDAATTYYWEQIATVPAMELPGYSFEAATAGDSVPGSNPYTLFMVEATASSGAYWMSAPDSGYSKDNLPPLPPAPVNAAYNTGGTTFHWATNTETDLANYRIYRGTGLSFTPSSGNLIASPTDTNYVDVTSSTYIYKMSAVDAHGNESAFTTITPSGVLGAGAIVPRELAFAIASQNPAPGSVTFRLSLPSESNVRLALFDAMGRRVRVLASGTLPAGDQTLRWDGTDDGGRAAPSGLYFARFDGVGRTLVRRLVIER